MKNIRNQDERVLTQRRRVQSDGFQLLIYALLISVVVQQFLFQAPPSQYMVEFLCVVGAGIYTTVRNFNLGNDISNFGQLNIKYIIKTTIWGGGISCLVFVILSGEKNISDILINFVIFAIAYGGMAYLFYYLNKKKQAKIEEDLDKDEDDID